jgi:hypothetical protein
MAFNIQSFKSNISSFGYLKPSHFEVGVAPPRFMQGAQLISSNGVSSVASMTDRLRFRIDQVVIPGASLMSSEVQVYGVGVQQKMPFNAFLHDSNFTVLVDKKAELWHFWYNWVRYINEFNGTETTAQLRNPSFNVRYKDDYSTTMQIVMYDDEGEVNTRVNLYEAFPSSVREIPLAWNDTGDLMRIAVSVTYSSYSIVGSNLVTPNEGARPLGGR